MRLVRLRRELPLPLCSDLDVPGSTSQGRTGVRLAPPDRPRTEDRSLEIHLHVSVRGSDPIPTVALELLAPDFRSRPRLDQRYGSGKCGRSALEMPELFGRHCRHGANPSRDVVRSQCGCGEPVCPGVGHECGRVERERRFAGTRRRGCLAFLNLHNAPTDEADRLLSIWRSSRCAAR